MGKGPDGQVPRPLGIKRHAPLEHLDGTTANALLIPAVGAKLRPAEPVERRLLHTLAGDMPPVAAADRYNDHLAAIGVMRGLFDLHPQAHLLGAHLAGLRPQGHRPADQQGQDQPPHRSLSPAARRLRSCAMRAARNAPGTSGSCVSQRLSASTKLSSNTRRTPSRPRLSSSASPGIGSEFVTSSPVPEARASPRATKDAASGPSSRSGNRAMLAASMALPA